MRSGSGAETLLAGAGWLALLALALSPTLAVAQAGAGQVSGPDAGEVSVQEQPGSSEDSGSALDSGTALGSERTALLQRRGGEGWRRVRRWHRRGARRHEAMMLRLSGGFGVARVSHPASSEGQPEREYRDVSMMLEVSLGGSVARNWLLHGTVTGFELRQPRVYEDGIDVGRPRRTLRVASLGTGLTRYLGPSNVYLHGGLGVGFVRLTGGEDSSWRSNPGLVLLAALGKEWWVGRGRWGLGCALRGEVVRVSAEVEEGISTPVQALLLGLAFSATLD